MGSSWGSDVQPTGLGLRWPCGKVNNVPSRTQQTDAHCAAVMQILCAACKGAEISLLLQVIPFQSEFILTHIHTRNHHTCMNISFQIVETCLLTLRVRNFLFALLQHVLLCILLPSKNVGASSEVTLLAEHVRNHLFLVFGRDSMRYKRGFKTFATLQQFVWSATGEGMVNRITFPLVCFNIVPVRLL